jgi:hypothetical protein
MAEEFAGKPGGGMPETLQEYWTTGKGGAEIGWGTDHSYSRCQKLLKGKVPGRMIDGACARLHKRATGEWPTEHGKAGIPS